MTTTLMLAFAVATQTFNLPPGLLSALCYQESHHNAAAIHMDDGGSPSLGICQIKLSTARDLGFVGVVQDLLDPTINVFYAGNFLHKQLIRYHGDPRKAIAAYNAGSFRENSQGLTKNRKYVSKVFAYWAQDK